MATRQVKDKQDTFIPPAERLPYHVIVKIPGSSGSGIMSHLFVFAIDSGSAINAVTDILLHDDKAKKGADLCDAQFICTQAIYHGQGTYSMS